MTTLHTRKHEITPNRWTDEELAALQAPHEQDAPMPKGEHFKNPTIPKNGDAIIMITLVTKQGIQKLKLRSTDFMGNTNINQRTPAYFQSALEAKIGKLTVE